MSVLYEVEQVVSAGDGWDVGDQGAYVEREDGGAALIASFGGDDAEEAGLFVRVQSWDPECRHKVFQKMRGKRVKVTVELMEDEDLSAWCTCGAKTPQARFHAPSCPAWKRAHETEG